VAHAPAYQALKIPIAACCDVVGARAATFAREFSIPVVETDYHRLLAREDVSAVSITVPNHLHASLTIAALQAGKHVLVEKPMATNQQEARSMVTAAARAQRVLMVGFNNRFRPETAWIKEAMTTGRFGRIHYVRAGWMRRRGTGWGWFTDRERSGGGTLIDIGVHALDLAHYLLGQPTPVRVSAYTANQLGRYRLKERQEWLAADVADGLEAGTTFSVEDLGVALIHFQNGATLLLEASWASNFGVEDQLHLELSGDRGGAQLFPLRWFGEEGGVLVDAIPKVGRVNAYQEEIREFWRAVTEGRPQATWCRGEEGVVVQTMLDAIYASAANHGRSVELT
jgi:predicted dehydrogenase